MESIPGTLHFSDGIDKRLSGCCIVSIVLIVRSVVSGPHLESYWKMESPLSPLVPKENEIEECLLVETLVAASQASPLHCTCSKRGASSTLRENCQSLPKSS